MSDTPTEAPTKVRYLVVFATAMAAIFMYVDRACLSQVKGDIQSELEISPAQMDWILGSFFFSYGLAQVPSGLLGAKYGLRRTMTILLIAWSLCTAACGLAIGFWSLIIARLAVGIAEAGAYPTAAALVKGWFPISVRGRANGMVALGGRLGWAVSQLATPFIVGHLYGWRGVLIVYGLLGVLWAWVFWYLVRDRASQHPWANDAERAYAGPAPTPAPVARKVADDIADYPDAPPPPKPNEDWPFRALATSRNMWLSGLAQFGVNVGWAFLITNLAGVLVTLGAGDKEKGVISAVPAVASIFGMFLGGFWGDFCMKRFGPRWGRSFPIGSMLCISGSAYAACTLLDDRWHLAIALAVMAMCIDLGVPSLWSFAQDVGGRHTGAALGWGNMFGNLGAGLSPILLGQMQRSFSLNTMFLVCAGCLFVAAGAAFCLNATKPVIRDEA